MTRSRLIDQIARANPHLLRRDAERILAVLLEEITQALMENKRVELRGFGIFGLKTRPARPARNPRTGKTLTALPRAVPVFRPAKRLRETLNPPQTSAQS